MVRYRADGWGGILPVLVISILLCSSIVLTGCLGSSYTPPDGSGRVLMEYHRSGGIAAFDDHLVIYENGTAMVTRRDAAGTFSLTSDELLALNGRVEQARFLDLRPSYPAPSPGADYFSYVVSYRGHTVHTEDTGVPADLLPLIQHLNVLLLRTCDSGDVCPL